MSTPVRRSLYGRLAGDTTLSNLLGTAAPGYTKSIYDGEAPAGANYPLIILNLQSDVPTEAMQDPNALENHVWLIKGVDRSTSADTAEAIAARIKTLLNDAALSISGGTHLYLRKQAGVQYSEVTDGVSFKHRGALYRLVYE